MPEPSTPTTNPAAPTATSTPESPRLPATPKPAGTPPTVATPPKPAAPPAPSAPAAAKPAVPAKPPEPPRPKTVTPDVTFLLDGFAGKATHVEDIDPKIPAIQIDRSALVDAARRLQQERNFEHLACITAIDYKTYFEVVYNLWSYSRNLPLALRVRVTREDPKLPTLTNLWAGADWLEREEYDLMGIVFDGHPNLKRILLPQGWKGHPLRKDYDLTHEQYVALDPSTGEDVVYQESREGAW